MATLEALHAAVIAAPDDEDARLAYAHAVAATDPERAELIRLQIDLTGWRRARVAPPEMTAAAQRVQVLLERNADRWSADVAPLVDGVSFFRGFVEHVQLDASRFLSTGPRLYQTAPVLHLDLTGVKPVAEELFRSPLLERIETLELMRNELGDAEATLIAASPHLARLKWLGLALNRIGDAGLDALAASKTLGALRYLCFADNATRDPTPANADDYSYDSEEAVALMAKHGARPWLSSQARWAWPPPRDAVVE
ncbi:MAG: hypothetical protein ABI678_32825 [Kofleriaceae bacterium]